MLTKDSSNSIVIASSVTCVAETDIMVISLHAMQHSIMACASLATLSLNIHDEQLTNDTPATSKYSGGFGL
jgi:hypothetical protein